MNQALIQAQFDHHTGAEGASASLSRLLALCSPQPGWRTLDIVAATVASRPLALATAQSALALADAAVLPFAAEAFDLVTCRLAAHHFPDVAAAVREMARVCRPGGLVAIADHIVPVHGPTARYINAFEKLRDPAHVRCYALPDWEGFFIAAGLEVIHTEEARQTLNFGEWIRRANVSAANRIRLEVLLRQAPAYAREALTPGGEGGRITFNLTEAVVIGRRKGAAYSVRGGLGDFA